MKALGFFMFRSVRKSLLFFNKTFSFLFRTFNFFWENIHPISIRIIFFPALFGGEFILSSVFSLWVLGASFKMSV